MANPARPVTATPIATAWGLAVADTVVRRYTNAAARDADLTGKTSAELLGQIVVLTGTGEVQQYVGPILGWRPPWSLPWGVLGATTNQGNAAANPGGVTILSLTVPYVAGRRTDRWAVVHGTCWAQGYLQLDGDVFRAQSTGAAGGGHDGSTFWTMHAFRAQASTVSAVADVRAVSVDVTGGLGPNWFQVADSGPAATPTAVEYEGWTTDLGDDVPGLVSRATHRDLEAITLAELGPALESLGLEVGGAILSP